MELLAECAQRIAQVTGLDSDTLETLLSEREALGTTAMPQGVAIPHCRVPGIDQVQLALVLVPQGQEFDAPDNQPTQLLIFMLSPTRQVRDHLLVLAAISRLLKRADFRERILRAQTPAEAAQVVAEFT